MATFFGRRREDELPEEEREFAGVPGVAEPDGALDPKLQAALITGGINQTIIGERDIQEAASILAKYKAGKANMENRVVQDELWWEIRHQEIIGKKKQDNTSPRPSSAWLFNSIINKHADAMDNYPEPVALPREQSDEESAKTLSSVLPVLLEYNEYDQTYSDNWWEKLKHGTACYGVFWNPEKENGLGDIDIRGIDLLKIFWEPGITDIQKSRNLFIVDLVDRDLLEEQYPECKGKLNGNVVEVKDYIYDDSVDTSDKALVVDWYYKRKLPSGQQIVHYVKFVGSTLLYASENDPAYQMRGFYDHGKYPVVFDVLFPEKGTPAGFGYVAICKDPQLYIDKLSANILENSLMNTKKRFFVSSSTNINEDEFLDWNKPFVHVEGELDDRRVQEIVCQPLSGIYPEIVQMKIEEMKDTASNRDVNSGGTGGGITAASAIAALQEAGNKVSRDIIQGSYRSYSEIISICIELIRQFYDESRAFRITAPNGMEYQFVEMNNAALKDQKMGMDSTGAMLYRRPIFDIKIKAQKKNPFSQMAQNETAKELYSMGFFSPDRAQEALMALDMMSFEGSDKVKEQVSEGQTLYNMVIQLKEENMKMKAILQGMTGAPLVDEEQIESAPTAQQQRPSGMGSNLNDSILKAQTPMTGYGERLAKRSTPSVDSVSNAAAPL